MKTETIQVLMDLRNAFAAKGRMVLAAMDKTKDKDEETFLKGQAAALAQICELYDSIIKDAEKAPEQAPAPEEEVYKPSATKKDDIMYG